MNEVECSGFERSLTECRFNRDSLGCSHEEDAAVRCNVPKMGFNTRVSHSVCHVQHQIHLQPWMGYLWVHLCPQLRLSGGRNPYEGRVEVLAERNGSMVWGTVCSDSWGTMEAMVVCKQLGLGFASHAFQVMILNQFFLPTRRVNIKP